MTFYASSTEKQQKNPTTSMILTTCAPSASASFDEQYKVIFKLLANVIAVHQSVDLLLRYMLMSKRFHQKERKKSLPPLTRKFIWMLLNIPVDTFATYAKTYLMDEVPRHMFHPVLVHFSRRCAMVIAKLTNDLDYVRLQWANQHQQQQQKNLQ
jgi:hypothetical protein